MEKVCCTLINLLVEVMFLWQFVSCVLFDRAFVELGLYKNKWVLFV